MRYSKYYWTSLCALLIVILVLAFTLFSVMALPLAYVETNVFPEGHSTIEIRFIDPPFPEPTWSDWTINSGLPLPGDFNFNPTSDRTYQINIPSGGSLPISLQYKHYAEVFINHGQTETIEDFGLPDINIPDNNQPDDITNLNPLANPLAYVETNVFADVHSTIEIRFVDPPFPEPTWSDWTINGGLPLPGDFNFNPTSDRTYQINIFSNILPESLQYKDYVGVLIQDGQIGIIFDDKSDLTYQTSLLIPLAILPQGPPESHDVGFYMLFNVPPYPPLTAADFTINSGQLISSMQHERVDDYQPLYRFSLLDMTELPSTLRFRDFPEVALFKNTLTQIIEIPATASHAYFNHVDNEDGTYDIDITIYYSGPAFPEPKLIDFTYDLGKQIVPGEWSSLEAVDLMHTEWKLSMLGTTVIPETLEIIGYHPIQLVQGQLIEIKPWVYRQVIRDPSPSGSNTDTALPSNSDTDTVLQTKHGADIPAKDKIVINEIANLSGENDWLELLNISDSPQSLDKWALSIVTEYNDETEIIRFPDISIPAGGILLLVNRDPANTALATGHNVQMNIESQAEGADERISYLIMKGETNYGFTSTGIALPNHNDWLLILRSGKPWDVKDGTNVYNTGYQIEDAAGPASITLEIDENEINLPKEKNKDGTEGGDLWHTTVFPLNGREETGEILLRYDRTLNEGTVHARNVNKHGFEVHSFDPAPFTGIGYDSDITDDGGHLGTPGYPNVVASNVSDLKTGRFIVSELMLTTNNGKNAQWIELHNTSQSEAISLEDPDGDGALTAWKMTIENHNSGSWKRIRRNLHVEVDLSEWFQYIPPRQKVLIAAFADRNSGASDFPSTRVATLWETHRRSFSMIKRGNLFLNASGGFTIKITDSQGNVSDSVGNLDGTAADPDEGIGHDDPVGFDWPTELTEDGHRTSLIRLKNTDGTPRTGMPTRDSSGDATDKKGTVLSLGGDETSDTTYYAWKHAADINLDDLAKITWFGSEDDISTPLNTENTMMPVLLSFFRPIMENGEVLIQWTTEAELDNAGFHILRSETRNGHFKRINTQLIQGAGSTAERQTYEWIDTTAKPGVVYYYQIEDVSFSGERYRLATTKLKGLVSAKNKLTTQWGALKRQD